MRRRSNVSVYMYMVPMVLSLRFYILVVLCVGKANSAVENVQNNSYCVLSQKSCEELTNTSDQLFKDNCYSDNYTGKPRSCKAACQRADNTLECLHNCGMCGWLNATSSYGQLTIVQKTSGASTTGTSTTSSYDKNSEHMISVRSDYPHDNNYSSTKTSADYYFHVTVVLAVTLSVVLVFMVFVFAILWKNRNMRIVDIVQGIFGDCYGSHHRGRRMSGHMYQRPTTEDDSHQHPHLDDNLSMHPTSDDDDLLDRV